MSRPSGSGHDPTSSKGRVARRRFGVRANPDYPAATRGAGQRWRDRRGSRRRQHARRRLPGIASTAIAKSDIAILNFALTLEYLEAAFYAEAVSKGNFSGETKVFADVVAAHEAAHVRFLRKALGAKAVKKPKFALKDTLTNVAKFQATANVLEDTASPRTSVRSETSKARRS